MSTEQIVWLVVGIIAVLAVVVAVVAASRKSRAVRQERQRRQAHEIREEVAAGTPGLESARTEAEKARAQADAAHARATKAERGAAQQEAELEDRLREADRLDPDVNHRSRDYEPDLDTVASDQAGDPARGDGTASHGTEDPVHRTPSEEGHGRHGVSDEGRPAREEHGAAGDVSRDRDREDRGVAPRTEQDHSGDEESRSGVEGRPGQEEGPRDDEAAQAHRPAGHEGTAHEGTAHENATEGGTGHGSSVDQGTSEQRADGGDAVDEERHRGEARGDEQAGESTPERTEGGSHRA